MFLMSIFTIPANCATIKFMESVISCHKKQTALSATVDVSCHITHFTTTELGSKTFYYSNISSGNTPIKYTDPDGRSETEETALGRDVHAMIVQRYKEAHWGQRIDGNNISMSSTLRDMGEMDSWQGRTDFGLKPDIWNVDTGDVYEIKPATEGVALARSKASLYVSLLQKAGQQKAHLGTTKDAGLGGMFIFKNKRIDYDSPEPGVIIYTVTNIKGRKNFAPVAQGIAATGAVYAMCKMLRALATGITLTPVAGFASLAFP
jgi:hypothetical protein